MVESPEPVVYTPSVKVEMTAKGAAMVTIHVYANDDTEARERAVALYQNTIGDLKSAKIPVASEVAK